MFAAVTTILFSASLRRILFVCFSVTTITHELLQLARSNLARMFLTRTLLNFKMKRLDFLDTLLLQDRSILLLTTAARQAQLG